MSLDIVSVVTREHGEKFADEWFRLSANGGAMTDACSRSGIMEWPDEDREQQGLFHEIEDQIVQRVADQLRSVIVETFVRLANEELSRELR
ncbi:MAG: hypothetical protein QOC81_3641 [Thermoanaerobaculia bacterium]|jgi:hypothetical protein|nr:hypothetical protein [Thermoanaerobaculia bacterium]